MLTIILVIATAVIFYLIGSNNPLPSVKTKIIAQAKTTVGKL